MCSFFQRRRKVFGHSGRFVQRSPSHRGAEGFGVMGQCRFRSSFVDFIFWCARQAFVLLWELEISGAHCSREFISPIDAW